MCFRFVTDFVVGRLPSAGRLFGGTHFDSVQWAFCGLGNESPTKLPSADTTRLVQHEWVLGYFQLLLRWLLRHSRGRGLVAGLLARVVHGDRVAGGWGIARGGGVRVRGKWTPLGCGGPFDRLRANGEGSKRACDVGWWGCAAARRTSGYRLSPVRRWRVWEVGEAETAPRRAPALDTGFRRYDGGGSAGRAGAGGYGGPFDRLRANGKGAKRACDVGWWGCAAARRTSGYRLSPVRRWRVWEVGEAETAPHRAPALDTGFRRYDCGGSAGRAGAGGDGGPPSCALRTGFDRLRANGRSLSVGIPAFSGMAVLSLAALRQAQGERNRASPLRFSWGRCALWGADWARRRGLRRRPCLWRCR